MATRRASITDLATALKLSPSTISRALSGHKDVSEATKVRVRALATELHYQPNQLAAALRRGRSKMLGVVVPHIQGHFFPEVVHGITAAASKAGYQVLICQSNEDAAQERQHLDLFMTAQVEGILVSLAKTTTDFSHFEQVRAQQVPLVFFDRAVEGFEGEQVRAVVLDDYQGAYQAVSGQGVEVALVAVFVNAQVLRPGQVRHAAAALAEEVRHSLVGPLVVVEHHGAHLLAFKPL
ncbi:MAG: LacI family transcriptional regulator, partial [Hymenobacter sp.]